MVLSFIPVPLPRRPRSASALPPLLAAPEVLDPAVDLLGAFPVLDPCLDDRPPAPPPAPPPAFRVSFLGPLTGLTTGPELLAVAPLPAEAPVPDDH